MRHLKKSLKIAGLGNWLKASGGMKQGCSKNKNYMDKTYRMWKVAPWKRAFVKNERIYQNRKFSLKIKGSITVV